MLKLEELKKLGIKVPNFDLDDLSKNTYNNPTWLHFGAGNIFRAYIARLDQDLLNKNLNDKGIIIALGYDYEMKELLFDPYDNKTISASLKANGQIDFEYICSITEALKADYTYEDDMERIIEIFRNPSLQMVTYTITEKGYVIKDNNGNYRKDVLEDLKNGYKYPISYMGKMAFFLYQRYLNNKLPLAMVSMDNCSKNGTVLKTSIMEIVKYWTDNNLVDKDFYNYVNDEKKISFPWTMIDKITPRPSSLVQDKLKELGLKDLNITTTSNKTFIAPFVNSEEKEYLVIEDRFPNGRPKLEEVGVYFADRETVDKVEKMKVTTCLNPLHTFLAIYGCLLDYHLIYDMMKNETIYKLVTKLGYQEGLPVVVDPKIINPKQFIDEVINDRLLNPFMPDSPQRIATDTSQKLPIRFGITIKSYLERNISLDKLVVIPLVFAGWIRYLTGINDNLEKFELSPDPLLHEFNNLKFETNKEIKLNDIEFILRRKDIFEHDLIEIGLDKKILYYLNEMNKGKDSIKNLLKTLTL